ncbi:37S ribosomal protein MRP51 [Drechslerella dactyloides]|uniref:37S ribosomal protein MRP51 n=1 Tax=Drechslerella dactyloides TaxID=74499 RepID=A0AAD6NIZ0_DREDA|nr:37S ribosomal protein MRP51 [Drechslerella dactyloides]
MSSKAAGPAASLIRHSRLVAMPAPRAGPALGDTQVHRAFYPTHQAITTPEASRHRGDWGLKRPIPRKVASSYLRYTDLDTIEHRTTFESSHDTVLSLKKWQEMGIPIKLFDQISGRFTSAFYFDDVPSVSLAPSVPSPPSSSKSSKSTSPSETSQPEQQITSTAAAAAKQAGVTPPVWGYREKFVQDMTPGELKTFIDKKLVPRRREFQEFAKTGSAKEDAPPAVNQAAVNQAAVNQAAVNQAAAAATDPPPEESKDAVADAAPGSVFRPNFAVEPIPEEIKVWRHDSLNSFNHVRAFLQIPLRHPPRVTHPSAGLYYALDPSYLENHPELGPLADRPIPTRVIHRLDLKMSDSSWRRRSFYLVGGFVVYALQDFVTRFALESTSNITHIVSVVPASADLDSEGKIRIEFEHSNYHQVYGSLIEGLTNKHRSRAESGKDDLAALRAARPSSQQEPLSDSSASSLSRTPQSLLTDKNGRAPPKATEFHDRLFGLLSRLNEAGRFEP